MKATQLVSDINTIGSRRKEMDDNTRRQMFAILSSSAEAADAALEDLRAVRDAIEVKVKAAIARANSAHRKLEEFEKEVL